MEYTPICLAAAGGDVVTVSNLMQLDPTLGDIPDDYTQGTSNIAIFEAAKRGHSKIVDLLLDQMHVKIETFAEANKELVVIDFITLLVESQLFGVLLRLLQRHSILAEVLFQEEHTLLSFITDNVSVEHEKEAVETVRFLCVKLIRTHNTENINQHLRRSVLLAASRGLLGIILEINEYAPGAISFVDDENMGIFHLAVKHRQVKVFNLVYQVSSYRDILVAGIDGSGNNILHLAAKLPHACELGEIIDPAMTMQKELQWFKAVEHIVPPTYLKRKNNAGQTPWMVFVEEHQQLAEKGEKWIREMVWSYMVLAAFIIVAGLGASIACRGGKTVMGNSFCIDEDAFRSFYTANAISMCLSMAVLLLFLSVLTTFRMDQRCFLESNPRLLIVGSFVLILSGLYQAFAFYAGTYTLEKDTMLPEFVIFLVVVSLFLLNPLRMLIKLSLSTYGPSKFRQQSNNLVC